MPKKLILIIIAIIAVVGLLLFSQAGTPEENEKPKEEMNEETEQEKDLDIIEEGDLTEAIMSDPSLEAIILIAVDRSDSIGAGYRLIKDGKLYHSVMVQLPDPPTGQYEGWLVQPSPLQFFSTGVLEKDEDGLWVIEYMSDQEFSEYYRVVITLETVIDATPEKHVLEGDFKR